MELLSAGNEEKVEIGNWQQGTVELAYTTASMLQISNAQKQEILSLESDLELLQRMNMIYGRSMRAEGDIEQGRRAVEGIYNQFTGWFPAQGCLTALLDGDTISFAHFLGL